MRGLGTMAEETQQVNDSLTGSVAINVSRQVPTGVSNISDVIAKNLAAIRPSSALVVQQTTPRKEVLSGEYDLKTVQRVLDIESYFSRSITKKRSVVLKEGYRLKCKDQNIKDQMYSRFMEMEYVSGIPFSLFMRDLVNEMLIFNNVFINKIRNEKSTSAKPAQLADGKKRQPIAALRILPTPFIEIKVDKKGKVIEYQVVNGGKIIEKLKPEDVIHAYRSRKRGALIGTPELIPVIDDIMALRRIEDNVETLVYRHAVPFLVVSVGTEKMPAKVISPDGTSELDLARQVIEGTEPGHAMIFPERYKVEVVGSKSSAIDVAPYLSHFKKRVFAGLSMSAYDFGETDSANRGSGEGLSLDFIDYCKDVQRDISIFIDMLLREMLVEIVGPERAFDLTTEVKFSFNEIDPHRRTREENATVQLFTSNLIDIDMAHERLEIEGEVDISKTFAAIIGSITRDAQSATNEATSKTTPSNQHSSTSVQNSAGYSVQASKRLSRSILKDSSKLHEITKELAKEHNISCQLASAVLYMADAASGNNKDPLVADIAFNNAIKTILISIGEKD